MSVQEDFEEYLTLLGTNVLNNVKTVTPVILKQTLLLHIDPGKGPEVFNPRMPRSAGEDEDNTVPRITVGSSIAACILGYYRVLDDLNCRPTEGYINGYTLNGFNFEYALKPNGNLVLDAEGTDEYWLVTYNEDTLVYKPTNLGHLFLQSVETIPDPTKPYNKVTAKFMLKLTTRQGIKLDRETSLGPGHYCITADLSRMNFNKGEPSQTRLTLSDKGIFQAALIDPVAYQHAKDRVAVSLETYAKRPIYFNWSSS